MVFLLVQGVVYTPVSSHYFIMCSDRSRFLSSFFKKGQPALVSVRDIIEANKTSIVVNKSIHHLAPVVQTFDSAIRWINIYPVDSAIGFPNTYLLDSDLSDG